MNLEGILARRPQVCLVDELAHSNVPGSKNRKRHEDVLDIVDAGIHVMTAVNIQHLEALNDAVAHSSGVRVRETVPDSFLKRADEVVNVDVTKEWASVAEMIETVLTRCAQALEGHTVKTHIQENLSRVKMDAKLVGEAFANRVENAGKYSPAASKIVLQARLHGERLNLTVIDQGPGIASEEMDRVFEKFYRGSLAAGRRREGTGMGLAIARGIAEAHGGSVSCENMPGGGAKFSLSIPVECKNPAEVLTAEKLE